MMLLSIMRYYNQGGADLVSSPPDYNNAASFVFIVFSWRFFKLFSVDV